MTLLKVTGLSRKPDSDEATLILQDLTGDLGLAFVIPMNDANLRLAATRSKHGPRRFGAAARLRHHAPVGESGGC